MSEQPGFEEWAVVELMGHARAAGRVTEQTIAGAGFLRIDVPRADGRIEYSRFVAPAAIYSITPVSQEVAIAMAQRIAAPPVARWELQLPAPAPAPGDPFVSAEALRGNQACVKCGCTNDDPCYDEHGQACGWVPEDELPEGTEGPLCTACLPSAAAEAAALVDCLSDAEHEACMVDTDRDDGPE